MKFGTFVLPLLLIPLLISTGALAANELDQKTERLPSNGRIDVIRASLSRGGLFLNVRFRIREVGSLNRPGSPMEIYVIEESTGERFYPRRFARIGALGQKHLDEGPISMVIIENTQKKIKKGSRVTLVIGNLRQEHIVVEE